MFGSSSPPVVSMSYLPYLCFLRIVVSNTSSVVFLFFFSSVFSKFQNLPLSNNLFPMRRKAEHFVPIMWNRNTFSHKNNTLTTQIQQRNIFFLAGASINLISATMQNLNCFPVS